jgi:hypothetical protein
MSLIKAAEARLALQDLFNADGLLAAATETIVTLTPAELFVENTHSVEILIAIEGPGDRIEGLLYLERARMDAFGNLDMLTEVAFDGTQREFAHQLKYDGPDLVSLKVRIDDLRGPAVFRPVFEWIPGSYRRFFGPAFVVKRPE